MHLSFQPHPRATAPRQGFLGALSGFSGPGLSSSLSYLGRRLYSETVAPAGCDPVTLVYAYGPDGDVVGFSIGESYYHFEKDLLGNVVAVYQGANLVASYGYTAFGRCEVYLPNGSIDTGPSSIGNLNPYRYRGYRYIAPAGAYWVGFRLYDPRVGRFVSPDTDDYLSPDGSNGVNPFVYCRNDPITYVDPTGHFAAFVALILAGAAIGAVSYAVSETISFAITHNWNWSWGQFVGSVIGGVIGGAFAAIGAGTFAVGFVTGFSSTTIGMSLQNGFEGTDYSSGEILLSSFSSGFISGVLSKGMDFIRVPRINAGRNSFAAITKSSITKSLNGTISSVSFKTALKMLVYVGFGSVSNTIWSGFSDGTDFYDQIEKSLSLELKERWGW